MKRNTPFWIYIFLAILSLLILFGTLLICYGKLFGGERPRYVTLQIPTLVGTRWDDSLLSDDFYTRVTYTYDKDSPAGTVLSQSPAANTERTTPEGKPVLLRVVVSLGKQTVTMPDLRGRDVRQAKQQLLAMGLCVSCRESLTSNQQAYSVLGQSAAAGTLLPEGSEVILTYAVPGATKNARVPDLYGLSPAEANVALMRAGLLPGNVIYADDATEQDTCTVSMQQTPAGSLVPIGTKIHYTLSRMVTLWKSPIAEESSKESADFTQ